MAKNKPFVFNDEKTVNSYGFIIPTSGISLKRFNKNPIMLDSHSNSTRAVLGNWENIQTKSGKLTGEPVFDSEDENVAEIQGKVERGFIKSCSMGVSFNREDLKLIAGKLILEKCELYEVSIVAIPSNANSIRLYASDSDKPLADADVKNLCLSISDGTPDLDINNEQTQENENMKITLTPVSAVALGWAITELQQEDSDVNIRIQKLSAEKLAAELKLEILEGDLEASNKTAIETEVELAFKAGKIKADSKEKFVNLGMTDRGLMTETLAAIPAKKSIAEQITSTGEEGVVKSMDDFQKLTHEAQLAFKTNQPEAYNKLVTNK